MNNNNFPLVVCLATPERKANYQWFEGSIALKDPNIKIETLEDLQNRGCTTPVDAKTNDLLILHPYEQNKYIHIEDVESAIIKASKFFKYKEILQELGALSYNVVSGNMRIYKAETDINVDGKASFKTPVESKVDVKNKEDFFSKMGFGLKATFDGVRTVSEESYNNAWSLIEKYRLQDDECIVSLVRARNPHIENHQRTEHLRYEAMQEFNKCVDVAVAFNVAKVFDLSAKIKHAISEKVDYSLEIDVAFPEQ